MQFLARFLLYLIHRLYLLYLSLHAFHKSLTRTPPKRLDAARRRIPKHLALCFSNLPQPSEDNEDNLVECVTNTADWCRATGIRRLTIYDEYSILTRCASRIERGLRNQLPESDASASEIEYPLTPPPSDYADSRPLSPIPSFSHVVTIEMPHYIRKTNNTLNVRKRRSHNRTKSITKPLTLCIISRSSAKPVIAAAAQSFLQTGMTTEQHPRLPQVTVDNLSMLLECESGLTSPDFIIVHSINLCDSRAPLELHGFPPWHIRLTEFYHNQCPAQLLTPERPRMFDETAFREALDEYAVAEFRFGR